MKVLLNFTYPKKEKKRKRIRFLLSSVLYSSWNRAKLMLSLSLSLSLSLILFLQRLYKSFKENQYPERATKESLAQELGLTFQKVLFFALTMKTVSFFLKNLVDIVVCFGSHFFFFSIFIG